MARVVTISTFLAAPPTRILEEVNKTRLLLFVTHPIMRFTPVDPPILPESWAPGDFIVRMHFFGILPLGRQTIGLSMPPMADDVRYIRDNGHSKLIRRWDHLISIAPEDGGTRYTDRVEIDAGVLTPFVVAFAHMFYRHRQRRWRQLVARDFDYGRF
ncbi:MAG: hypothetical protein AAFY14_08680 [Pseudomonadota bacterium]